MSTNSSWWWCSEHPHACLSICIGAVVAPPIHDVGEAYACVCNKCLARVLTDSLASARRLLQVGLSAAEQWLSEAVVTANGLQMQHKPPGVLGTTIKLRSVHDHAAHDVQMKIAKLRTLLL